MSWKERFGTTFDEASVLITGGMGFVGSNLAIALVNLGAKVTLVDNMGAEYGGNLFNIEPIKDKVTVNFSDIRDATTMNYIVRGHDYVFHLASQVDHVLSLSNPYPDIDINITGTAVLMEAIRHNNPSARVIYTGTRGQYGESISLPVNEDAPTYPRGLHEISSLTAEKIVYMYHDIHGISSVLLRLTNIFGPRAQMKHSRYGVVNWFIRLSLEDKIIRVFGDGQIIRDFLYIEDCIDAMLACTQETATYGEILNVASGQATNFIELASAIVKATGRGKWEFAPFSPARKAQEPGNFVADISKIVQLTDWRPVWSLEDGLAETSEYYEKFHEHYW